MAKIFILQITYFKESLQECLIRCNDRTEWERMNPGSAGFLFFYVASGEPVNNEKKNYREIAIFKTGVTL